MLNLVYDSIFLLRELCMHCVSSVMVSLIGFVSTSASSSSHSSMDSSYMDISFYGSMYIQDEY